MAEKIAIHDLSNIPNPYNGWVSKRNGAIGQHVAGLVGAEDTVTVATRPVTRDEVQGIDGYFYGTVVGDHADVHKTVLQPTFGETNTFAATALDNGYVLPGIRIDNPKSLLDGYKQLVGTSVVRAKLPDGSDGNGQFELRSKKAAQKLVKRMRGQIEENGIILEPQIKNPRTISVGFATFGEETYSFIARQRDARVVQYNESLDKEVTKSRYQGASVTVVRGGMQSLLELPGLDRHAVNAINTSAAFYDEYQLAYGFQTNRMSFDYMYGRPEERSGRSKKDVIGGITDITARPGGTDPALLLAARELQNDPSLTHVSAEVVLDYEGIQEIPEHAELFVDDPDLLIFAYVTAKHGAFVPGGKE